MDQARTNRAMTLLGAALLALTVGVMAKRSVPATLLGGEEMRDAVASPIAPISPAMLGAARVIRPESGWFATPAVRRAEAEHALLASRLTNVSKAMSSRAAKLRARKAAAQ